MVRKKKRMMTETNGDEDGSDDTINIGDDDKSTNTLTKEELEKKQRTSSHS